MASLDLLQRSNAGEGPFMGLLFSSDIYNYLIILGLVGRWCSLVFHTIVYKFKEYLIAFL